MIAGQTLTLPQLLLRAAAELAAVVIAGKQECVGDLATEAARDVDESNQADDGRSWYRQSFAMDRRSLGLDDLGLAVDDQPQRPAHGHHRERLERSIEGQATHHASPRKKTVSTNIRGGPICYTDGQLAASVAFTDAEQWAFGLGVNNGSSGVKKRAEFFDLFFD